LPSHSIDNLFFKIGSLLGVLRYPKLKTNLPLIFDLLAWWVPLEFGLGAVPLYFLVPTTNYALEKWWNGFEFDSNGWLKNVGEGGELGPTGFNAFFGYVGFLVIYIYSSVLFASRKTNATISFRLAVRSFFLFGRNFQNHFFYFLYCCFDQSLFDLF
jgi:hypothetical protein